MPGIPNYPPNIGKELQIDTGSLFSAIRKIAYVVNGLQFQTNVMLMHVLDIKSCLEKKPIVCKMSNFLFYFNKLVLGLWQKLKISFH